MCDQIFGREKNRFPQKNRETRRGNNLVFSRPKTRIPQIFQAPKRQKIFPAKKGGECGGKNCSGAFETTLGGEGGGRIDSLSLARSCDEDMKINLDVLSPKSVRRATERRTNSLIVLSGRNLISHSTPRSRSLGPVFDSHPPFLLIFKPLQSPLPLLRFGRFLSVRYLSSADPVLSSARFSALPLSLTRSSPNMLIVIPSISYSPPRRLHPSLNRTCRMAPKVTKSFCRAHSDTDGQRRQRITSS